MLSNLPATIDSNFSMPLNLNSGDTQKDLFNITSSGYFDPPPPPGGPGTPFSSFFNQIPFNVVALEITDLSFLNRFSISDILNTIKSCLSSKPNITSFLKEGHVSNPLSSYKKETPLEGKFFLHKSLEQLPNPSRVLQVYGALVSAEAKPYMLPLQRAAEQNDVTGFFRIMEQYGITALDNGGGGLMLPLPLPFENRPIDIAVAANQTPLLEEMKRRGIDLNAQTATFKNTPLHKALTSKSENSFRFLLTAGCDPTLENALHKSVRDLVEKPGNEQFKEILNEF